MIQSVLLIRESRPARPGSGRTGSHCSPDAKTGKTGGYGENAGTLLRNMGYEVHSASVSDDREVLDRMPDLVLLETSPETGAEWIRKIRAVRKIPVFWWAQDPDLGSDAVSRLIEQNVEGMIYPSMNAEQIRWSFSVGVRHYMNRVRWEREKEMYVTRLEERKWIDQAKAVLSEIQQISEEEAYELLRRQAMNERRKMAEVAASIVKVYRMIRGNGR